MKRIIFILVAVLSCYSAAFAKQPQEPSSYNYQRGKELINNEEYSDGIAMLRKELADNPKNGYLSKKDIVGNSAYMTADGAISIGTNIILQKINFGGLELKAVRASVVGNQKAPLLLGQSVLQRLGKIEIDNQRQVLKITTKAQ